MAYEVDSDKVQTLFLRCLLARKKFEEKKISRKKLVDQLESLRKVKINKAFQHELDELDKRLADLLEKERTIVSSQKAEHSLNERLNVKIIDLEKKLTGYLDFKKNKIKRIKELETRVEKRIEEKARKAKLKGKIEGLELVFNGLKRAGGFPADKLQKIQNKIKELKKQVA